MNKYKMIVFDVDGTLYNSSQKILDSTFEVLDECKRRGIKIIIASGRSLDSTLDIREQLKLNDFPIINFNGARVQIPNKEVLYNKTMDPELAMSVIQTGRDEHFTILVYYDEKLYIEKHTKEVDFYVSLSKMKLNLVDSLDEIAKKRPTKIILTKEKDEDVIKIISREKKKYDGKLNVNTSIKKFLEFVDISASKSHGIEIIANLYNIQNDDIMVFGDGLNDVDMIEHAGFGIAMGNGSKEAKAAAKYVTDTNDNDGISKAIKKFVFGES